MLLKEVPERRADGYNYGTSVDISPTAKMLSLWPQTLVGFLGVVLILRYPMNACTQACSSRIYF